MMKPYDTQIKKLTARVLSSKTDVLYVYDIDGTLTAHCADKRFASLERKPVEPFILMSSRASAFKGMTRMWCDMNGLRPLAIFHRSVDVWSIEACNLDRFKPTLLFKLQCALGGVQLCVYDDEQVDGTLIDFYHLERIMFHQVPRIA